jgi:hypothetical protein
MPVVAVTEVHVSALSKFFVFCYRKLNNYEGNTITQKYVVLMCHVTLNLDA